LWRLQCEKIDEIGNLRSLSEQIVEPWVSEKSAVELFDKQ
jgi:hypothetical protein